VIAGARKLNISNKTEGEVVYPLALSTRHGQLSW
jgi:hypothetical protein